MSLTPLRRARLALGAIALAACSSADVTVPREGSPSLASDPMAFPVEERPLVPLPALPEAPRGLGTMSARVPGTSEATGGVHLESHHARVTIEHGIAHTEVEEEFRNDTGRVLEGRLELPLPADATLARLALWVGRELVEGEVVERRRADRIFRGIVDDTVRPRDPALLDVVAGGKVSLRIFPIPAHGARKVVFAYDQLLRREAGVLRYVHPLSLGGDRATAIDSLSVTVNGVTKLSRTNVVPAEDVVVVIDEPPPAIVSGVRSDRKTTTRAIAARSVAHAPEGARPFHGNVAITLDVSEGQSSASLAAQEHLVDATLARLEADESFVLLACDTACVTYPREGLAAKTADELDEARRFLSALIPGGASDPAGALNEAASRLPATTPAQIVFLSDGNATAGELSVATQLAHVAASLTAMDVRVVGIGRAVDDRGLSALARGLGATYDRFATGASLVDRVQALAEARRTPVVRDARAELPDGAFDAEPAGPVPTRDGDEVVVFARVEGAAVGTEAGLAIPRLWARARIAELETRGEDANAEITALAVQHHLLSRATSLLVLENDRMFAEFGIPRTSAPDQAPDVGELQTGHVARAPTVRMGSTMVSGRLPPETVQRIVRQNFGRFRQCFENGLRRHDALSGRVIARFVIGRDGSVASTVDGGSDLPDAEVVSCVVRSFARLSFPPPEGGTVTVVYPIVFSGEGSGQAKPETEPQRLSQPLHRTFSPDMGRLPANSALNPPPWQPPPVAPPTVAHRPGDDAWRATRPASLDPLLARVERDPARRRGHADAIRALVAAGRMEDAHASAQRFVMLDPDSPVAREALADTAAATFRREEAVSAMASAAALDPRSKARQLGAMRAALAVGDGRRACAHARALGELAPRDHATLAEGCRASGAITAPDVSPGGFEAKVTCDGTSCGDVVVITPGGRILSRWSRGASGGDRIIGPLMAGTYRTLVAPGEASGTVSVRALGVTFDAAIGRGEPRTAIASEVMIPAPYRALRVRI